MGSSILPRCAKPQHRRAGRNLGGARRPRKVHIELPEAEPEPSPVLTPSPPLPALARHEFDFSDLDRLLDLTDQAIRHAQRVLEVHAKAPPGTPPLLRRRRPLGIAIPASWVSIRLNRTVGGELSLNGQNPRSRTILVSLTRAPLHVDDSVTVPTHCRRVLVRVRQQRARTSRRAPNPSGRRSRRTPRLCRRAPLC